MPDTPSIRATADELLLHQRLLAGEVIATSDLADAYLVPLIGWLAEHNPATDEAMRNEAAEDAILSLVRNPSSYDPTRQSLCVYLRMSARGDLLNLLARESRHTRGRRSLESVELSADGRKCLGREDDPSLPLRIAEETREAQEAVPASVREGLSEEEASVLDLMLGGERSTKVYAEALGIADRPAGEQKREVKRAKDRLQKRLDRAREPR